MENDNQFTIIAILLVINICYSLVQIKQLITKKIVAHRLSSSYNLLIKWFYLKTRNKELHNFFIQNGFRTIAIYGMGELGRLLYNELENTDIIVKYYIDKKTIVSLVENKIDYIADAELDVIVVTPVYDFEKIESNLGKIYKCPVISLDEILAYFEGD